MQQKRLSTSDTYVLPRATCASSPWLRSLFLAAAAVVLSMTCVAAGANDFWQYQKVTSAELSQLPPYCPYTQLFRNQLPGGPDNPQVKYWYERMGETFHAMHHYCWGLNAFSRAQHAGASAQVRHHLLTSSVDEYDYVIRYAPGNFVLLPEIRTKKGQSLARLGRNPQAASEFAQAIQLKPDYWPPYAYLSDLHVDLGDIANARRVLDAGLKKVPDAQALLRRRAALDQKRTEKPSAR